MPTAWKIARVVPPKPLAAAVAKAFGVKLLKYVWMVNPKDKTLGLRRLP